MTNLGDSIIHIVVGAGIVLLLLPRVRPLIEFVKAISVGCRAKRAIRRYSSSEASVAYAKFARAHDSSLRTDFPDGADNGETAEFISRALVSDHPEDNIL